MLNATAERQQGKSDKPCMVGGLMVSWFKLVSRLLTALLLMFIFLNSVTNVLLRRFCRCGKQNHE